MLKARRAAVKSPWVIPGDSLDAPILGTTVDHQHDEVRTKLKLPKDFVLHSLRHTMLTHLGETVADAFTIVWIAGHSSVTVSQRYVHPTPENMERAFERLQKLNTLKQQEAEAEAKAEAVAAGAAGISVLRASPKVTIGRPVNPPKLLHLRRTGP